ncbi:MAG: metalloregulator ArsR/SmtB family transcription factor [Anaerolineae bacterium]|jgi:ArsR family transcriptional regulator|nr:metalloregulator ArsR/SmtB family transcription factor [Anaerolineae bacterium]
MEITQRQADVCSGLADIHRILMMYALAERTHNVSELAARLKLSQPAVSRHLKIMRECGLVLSERQGKSVYYTPADVRIVQAMDLLRAVLTERMKQEGQLATQAAERPAI